LLDFGVNLVFVILKSGFDSGQALLQFNESLLLLFSEVLVVFEVMLLVAFDASCTGGLAALEAYHGELFTSVLCACRGGLLFFTFSHCHIKREILLERVKVSASQALSASGTSRRVQLQHLREADPAEGVATEADKQGFSLGRELLAT